MTPVELATVLIAAITLITGLVVPWWLRRRSANHDADVTEVVSWRSITEVLQSERDSLRTQLDEYEADTRARMRALAIDHRDELAEVTSQLLTARARVAALESELSQLYIRLGRAAPGP